MNKFILLSIALTNLIYFAPAFAGDQQYKPVPTAENLYAEVKREDTNCCCFDCHQELGEYVCCCCCCKCDAFCKDLTQICTQLAEAQNHSHRVCCLIGVFCIIGIGVNCAEFGAKLLQHPRQVCADTSSRILCCCKTKERADE